MSEENKNENAETQEQASCETEKNVSENPAENSENAGEKTDSAEEQKELTDAEKISALEKEVQELNTQALYKAA